MTLTINFQAQCRNESRDSEQDLEATHYAQVIREGHFD